MNKINLIQGSLWAAFLIYYCASKFLAGYSGYSHAYAIQVGIIVLSTALAPYYLTQFCMRFLAKVRLFLAAVMPTLLAMAGYATFFYLFIAPNFPDIAAQQVIIRGLLPGLVISGILLLPNIIAAIQAWQSEEPVTKTA